MAPLVIATVAALVLIAGGIGFIRAGIYNVGADDPHLPMTYAMLGQLREASIQARAGKLQVPADLMSAGRISQGAGNYDAMCTQCHLAPGIDSTELSRGLYPAPPDLTKEQVDAAAAFWVIKHGIKGSGMPAWGGSMDDDYIWGMAAFLQKLPKLDPAEYAALVASSGGHSHGGGETMPAGPPMSADMNAHEPGAAPHHDPPAGLPAKGDTTDKPKHVDPPGAPAHTH